MKEDLTSKLNRMLQTYDVVNFTYKKKNGEERHARGTRKISVLVENDAVPEGTGSHKFGVVAYYDLDKESWRSCQEDSVISIETVEPNNMFN